MVALTTDRNTPKRERDDIEEHPVLNGAVIFSGALVCLNVARLAVPGNITTGFLAVGRAEEKVVGDGVKTVRVRRGIHRWANGTAGDLITRAEIGSQAFVLDDQTVGRTSNSGSRPAAGIIRDVDAQGVWVLI